MSALVVVLKHFSPFSSGDKEVDLATLPPPPAPEELDPMFLGKLWICSWRLLCPFLIFCVMEFRLDVCDDSEFMCFCMGT